MFANKIFNPLVMIAVVVLLAVAGHFDLIHHSDTIFLGLGGVLANSGARIIDPILTNYAQGYKNAEFVGNMLFPRVPVNASGGQIIEFGKEAFLSYNLRRTPGGATKRIQFGYLGKPFALLQDSVEVPVPREHLRDAAAVPGIDLGTRAVGLGMKVVLKSLEVDQANMATLATNYDANHKVTLAGATKWSAATGTPTLDVQAGREAIRASIGVYPNVGVISAVAFNAAKNNPNVTARFQYTSHDAITPAMLANLWELDQLIIGKGIAMTDAGVASDIWGNNMVLAYTNLGSMNAEEPSFGYTYTMEGNPMVEQTYWDAATKSWIYPANFERAPVLSGITAGFLLIAPN